MQLSKSLKFGGIIKAVLLSVMTALVAVLIFAVIVKFAHISDGAVKGVNQFIKVVSIFIGCYFSLSKEKGLISGGITGLIFGILTYFLFSLIGGGISMSINFLWDVLLCCVIGALSGALTVNLKK